MFKKFAVGLVVVLLALAPSIASAKSLSISGTAKFSTGPDTVRFNTTATGMDTLIGASDTVWTSSSMDLRGYDKAYVQVQLKALNAGHTNPNTNTLYLRYSLDGTNFSPHLALNTALDAVSWTADAGIWTLFAEIGDHTTQVGTDPAIARGLGCPYVYVGVGSNAAEDAEDSVTVKVLWSGVKSKN